MKYLHKIKPMLDIGGLNLLLFKTEDKIMGSDNGEKYLYRILKAADEKDYPFLLSKLYIINTGKTLDLQNPVTFNEKIQWMKLHDSTAEKTRLADKYLVRDFVSSNVGDEYLVPLLGVWDRFDDIDFDMLPDDFALKCNHGSGWNLICRDKKEIDWVYYRSKFNEWMNMNFAYLNGEYHYRDIPRKIIAEEYLDMSDGVKDYRFFCFNGKAYQVWVDLYSGTPDHIRSIFDMDWQKLDIRCTWPDGGDALKDKPLSFELMRVIAEKLSEGFSFVRVDLFEIRGRIYVGELTFTPMNGTGKFDPPYWDKKLGDLITLPQSLIMTDKQ